MARPLIMAGDKNQLALYFMRIRSRAAQPQPLSFKRTRRAGDCKRRVRGVLINSILNAPKGIQHYQALQDYRGFESRMASNLVDTYV